jgi:hypothetical protein
VPALGARTPTVAVAVRGELAKKRIPITPINATTTRKKLVRSQGFFVVSVAVTERLAVWVALGWWRVVVAFGLVAVVTVACTPPTRFALAFLEER